MYWAWENDGDVSVEWKVQTSSSSDGISVTSVATLVAVTIVSSSCCALCLACTYKALRRIGLGRTYQDRSRLESLFGDFTRRVHPMMIPAMLSHLPSVPYTRALVEVGEPVCTICLQE